MTDLHTEYAKGEEVDAFASIRLQALVTDPSSYLASIADEVDRTPEDWKEFLARPNRTEPQSWDIQQLVPLNSWEYF